MNLTPKAQANLDAGFVVGAGTHRCKKCKSDKETTRLNSSNCHACDHAGRKPAAPKPPPRPAPPTRLLRVDLPTEVWDALDAEAADRGVKVGSFVRDMLVRRHTKKNARP